MADELPGKPEVRIIKRKLLTASTNYGGTSAKQHQQSTPSSSTSSGGAIFSNKMNICYMPMPKTLLQNSNTSSIIGAAANAVETTNSTSLLNDNNDEYLILAKSYASKLKNMTTVQRLYADRLINEVLLEGQLSTLSRNSEILAVPIFQKSEFNFLADTNQLVSTKYETSESNQS